MNGNGHMIGIRNSESCPQGGWSLMAWHDSFDAFLLTRIIARVIASDKNGWEVQTQVGT